MNPTGFKLWSSFQYRFFVCLVLVVSGPSCQSSQSPTQPSTNQAQPNTHSGTSPETALEAIASALETGDVDAYASLLSSEFRYRHGLSGLFGRERELEAMSCVLISRDIVSIDLTFTRRPAEPSSLVALPAARRIRVHEFEGVATDSFGGRSLLYHAEIFDFYFERGNPAVGEDPGRWYLVLWQEHFVTDCGDTHWGLAKAECLNPPARD
ncbi:MAG: hypothetical protein HKN21_02640 [Candidatus Eisenbacteria bacterium]|uniref:Uncharacterized protein n=1 Tax=Eiseniibacteriota bacterium TaxID=2212470 RepID=A0A7Y2E769_UNCEI|nr:hypothetical protein [Candidatus Eisenbacteria bacterium]